MINPTAALTRLEREYAEGAYANWTYHDALRWYEAAWKYARTLNPNFGADWLEDLEPDFAIARMLNGIPEPDSPKRIRPVD